MADDIPIYTFTNPAITLNGVDVRCFSTHFGWTVDTATTDVTTFCGVRTLPGQTSYTLNATLLLTFGEDSAFELLGECAGLSDPVEWTLRPFADKPIGPENPQWSGVATPSPWGVDADAGGPVEIPITWDTTRPVCTTTPVANGSAASAPAAA